MRIMVEVVVVDAMVEALYQWEMIELKSATTVSALSHETLNPMLGLGLPSLFRRSEKGLSIAFLRFPMDGERLGHIFSYFKQNQPTFLRACFLM